MVPRSQVRILAPQPFTTRRDRLDIRSSRHGRRPRNAHALGRPEAPAPDPRPADGRLGRSRPRGRSAPEPLVVVASPESRGRVRRRRGRRAGARARDRRRRPRGARRRSATEPASVLVLSGDTPLLTTELLEQLVETHRRERRGRDRPLVRAGRRPLRTAASSATPTATSRRSSRPATRRPSSSRSASATPRSTSSRADVLWPALERLEPHNAQGELYLTDAVRDLVERRRARRRRIVADDPTETEGVNTRVELAAAAAALPRPDQPRAHARRRRRSSTRPRPGSSPSVELEPDAVVHPFTVLRGSTSGRRRRRDRPARRRDRRGDRARARSSGRSVTFAPARCSGRARRPARSWRSRTREIGEGAKVPHLSYIGDAEIGEGTNIGAGDDHRELPAPPRPAARGGRRSASNVRVAVDTMFVAPVDCRRRCVDGGGSGRHRRRPGERARRLRAARQVNKEGRGGKRTIEQPLPGLEGTSGDPLQPQLAARPRWIRCSPRSGSPSSRAARTPSSPSKIAGHLGVELGDVRAEDVRRRRDRTAASRSRSAARTCSSSRPRASPIAQHLVGAPDHGQRREARVREADHRGDPLVLLRAPGQEVARRASRSPRASSPTCSRPPASTA